MKKTVIASVASAIISVNLAAAPAIWLIGDSTVASYPKTSEPLTGWGQVLNQYCKPGVKVFNHAISGRSTKSFIAEKRWDKVIAGVKKGDFLLIQFGHNDQKKDPARHAPANGLYKELLKKFIAEAKAKGVNTVLVTPVMRRSYDKKTGELRNSLGGYPNAMQEVAKETGTPLINLNQIMFDKMKPMTKEETKKLYNHCPPGKYKKWIKGREDNSHFNTYGAKTVSGWLVADAKKQKLAVAELFK